MIESILNGISPEAFWAYVFYAVLGVVISWLSESYKHAKPIKKSGGWKIVVWIQENWKRALMVAIAVFIGIVFMNEFSGSPASNFGALTLGLTLDVLIDRIFKKKA